MKECRKNLSPDRPSKILDPDGYAKKTPPPKFSRPKYNAPAITISEAARQQPINSEPPPSNAAQSVTTTAPSPSSKFKQRPESYSDIKTARERVKLQSDTMLLLELKQNKLIETDYLRKTLGDMVITLKTRLLAMASELAPEVAVISDASVCLSVIERYVNESLSELSQWRPPDIVSDEDVEEEIAS